MARVLINLSLLVSSALGSLLLGLLLLGRYEHHLGADVASTYLATPELLGWLCLEELDPEPALRNLGLLKHVERVHATRNFVDDLGHPTRRGHRIIAEGIFDYLSRSDRPLRTAPPPRLPD